MRSRLTDGRRCLVVAAWLLILLLAWWAARHFLPPADWPLTVSADGRPSISAGHRGRESRRPTARFDRAFAEKVDPPQPDGLHLQPDAARDRGQPAAGRPGRAVLIIGASTARQHLARSSGRDVEFAGDSVRGHDRRERGDRDRDRDLLLPGRRRRAAAASSSCSWSACSAWWSSSTTGRSRSQASGEPRRADPPHPGWSSHPDGAGSSAQTVTTTSMPSPSRSGAPLML